MQGSVDVTGDKWIVEKDDGEESSETRQREGH